MEVGVPPSIRSWMAPITTQASDVKAIPPVMRRSVVGSQPRWRSRGNNSKLLNGINSITSMGLSACIWAGRNQSGLVMSLACTIQVEAFWSNSDQNGVTSENTIRMRSTARTPSIVSSGWTPRARSSCIAVPMPPKASSSTTARQAAITKPHWGVMHNEATAPATPTPATVRPGRDWPGWRASSAVRATRNTEWGSAAAGGTCTYFLFPIQNTTVAMNISSPGMPNATAAPKSRRKMGVSSEAKKEPKLMIQ